MRKLVFQMMTTLNGRLDDPDAWVTGISDDHYQEIDRVYGTFDTILVGHDTYEEMFAYWPGAETDESSSETTRSMARKMNTYKKVVFSRSAESATLPWNNAEQVHCQGDDDIIRFIQSLKAQPGKDIHLAGGARFAQSIMRLGLVDEYHFFVYPVISEGISWFEALVGKELKLLSTTVFENGVVGLYYTHTG
jgi:dihydrofolate reductase